MLSVIMLSAILMSVVAPSFIMFQKIKAGLPKKYFPRIRDSVLLPPPPSYPSLLERTCYCCEVLE
jgi:hypothetical protein